ncbi:hypothetical protein ACFLT4_04135 [Chloroflexota bacterium]
MELEQANEVELDLPPEYCHYRDEDCELSDSCLSCPFSKCIYDKPGGKQRWLKRLRAREMVRLFTTRGKEIKELALIFGVSRRTVQRALKNVLDESNRKEVSNNG